MNKRNENKNIIKVKKNSKHKNENLDKEFKTLYSTLLQFVGKESSLSSKENQKDLIIQKLWDLINSKFLQVCRKPVYSRGIQSILKWGSNNYRINIFEKMKDHLVSLSIDSHSSRIIEKMYNYGNTEIRKQIRQELLSKFEQIGYSKFGSRVFAHVFSEKRNPSESWESIKNEILHRILSTKLAEFYYLGKNQKIKNLTFTSFFQELNNDNAKKSILDNSVTTIQKFVDSELLDKHFVHILIWNYIKCCVIYYTNIQIEDSNNKYKKNNQFLDLNSLSDEGKSLLTTLLEQILEGAYSLLSTKEGVDSLIVLLGFAKAQQRKKLLKMIKKDIFALSTNPVDYSLILRLISTTDDTKILNEIIWNSFISNNKLKKELLINSYSIKLLSYLLIDKPNLRNFNQYEFWILNLKSFTSLKPINISKKEMNIICIPALNNTIFDLEDKDTILEHLIKDLNGKELILLLLNYFIKEGKTDNTYNEKIQLLMKSILSLIENKNELLKDNIGHRTIVSILKLINEQDPSISTIFDPLRNTIINIFQNSLIEMLKSKAVFILVEIIGQNLEQTDFKACTMWRIRIKELVKGVINDCIIELDKNGSNTTGIQLILQYTNLKLPNLSNSKYEKNELVKTSNNKKQKRLDLSINAISFEKENKKNRL